jgi:hypothetical protein
VSPTLSLVSLGRVVADRQGFHTARHIFPVGFRSERLFASLRNPAERCVYASEIRDGGERGPLFVVTCADAPDRPMTGASASGAWAQVERELDALRGRARATVNVNGAERFGLPDPTIAQLIAQLPGAERCVQFQMSRVVSARR